MEIKSDRKKKQKININLFLKIYFILSILIIGSISLLFFNTGYWNNYKNQFLYRLYVSSVNNYIYLPKIIFNAVKSKFYNIEKLNLNISFENIINLENQRDKALKNQGWSINFSNVKSKIDYQGNTYNANLRLKGARKIHYNEKRNLSYKIEINDDQKIFGLRKFSLQKPRARNYGHEWLFHELIKETNLVNLKYEFVELTVNGSKPGLYVIEEGFDKILLERNNRRNGPIFSLYEEFSANFLDAKFEVYNKGYWLDSSNLDFTSNARRKLDKYKNSEIALDKVMDINKWAEFLAITDLNYYAHARDPKSVKFYYNPVSALFEPIGYDAHRSVPNYNNLIYKKFIRPSLTAYDLALMCSKDLFECKNNTNAFAGSYFLYKFFFNDDGSINNKFYKNYQKKVLKFSSKDFLDAFFKNKNKELERVNNLIYGDYFFVDNNYFYGPGLYYFDKKDIYKRAEDLQKKYKPDLTKIIIEQHGDQIKISNLSLNNNLLSVNNLNCQSNQKQNYELININYVLTGKNNSFKINKNFKNNHLICKEIYFKDQNGNTLSKNIYLDSSAKNITKLNENDYKKYFFEDGKNLKLRNKNTVIKSNIIIPKGFIVKIESGDKINLINNAFIFSKSPWIAFGKKEIIEISGLKDNFGGGLYIFETYKTSLFKNVKFRYLSGLKKPYFLGISDKYLTTISSYKNLNSYYEKINFNPDEEILYNLNYILMGSINFFNTKVELEEVYFEKICSEDALNIISSVFKINNAKFSENCSDSIDVDFGTGQIINSSFKEVGNDAIDFSGSNAKINNIFLKNVGDKLISVGEKSKLNIKNINASNSFVGIVSKDGSIVEVDKINFENIKIALAAYIKKSEYNKSFIKAKNIEINNSKVQAITDFNSIINISKNIPITKNKKLIEIIYKQNLQFLK
jgi:hypothetical protein